MVGDLSEYKETSLKENDEMDEEDKSGANVQGAGAADPAKAAPAEQKKKRNGSTTTTLLPRP